MTKKAEKAERVAENKRIAWRNKVRSLIGHLIYEFHFSMAGSNKLEMDVAYIDGITADAFAAEIASREPVGKVVHPLKVEAVEYARIEAEKEIAAVVADLEAKGWDINIAAPYPSSNMNRNEYNRRVERYQLYSRLTETADSRNYGRSNEPRIVVMSDSGKASYVLRKMESAAFQYDAFICKLVQKVGPVKSAVLFGSHVWAESVLTVTKETDGGKLIESWRTHQIWNQSKFGLSFPQWPTRLVK